MTNNTILSVEHLRKFFKSGEQTLAVLSDVSFAIEAGSACAIVGPSGSGKTTLIAICAGLERPSEGSVVFNGVAMHGSNEKELAQIRNQFIGFIFQSFQLLPSLTALENVMVPAEIRGENHARSRAADLLQRVGLEGRLHHYPIQLSGGEQQRVAIARAFMNRPKILFADEPTGNLDAETAKEIVRLIFELNATTGTTLVLVTHDPDLTRQAGRVLSLKAGRLVGDHRKRKKISQRGWRMRIANRPCHESSLKIWVWSMALRDARRGLKPLLLSMSCVILGVASIVVAFSFRDNLQSSIRTQSKSLLGADLAIDSREPFSQEAEALIASLGGDQSRQIGFASMAYFPGSGASRLVQVRAISGKFPYYGALETEPPSAVQQFQDGPNALVDENVMLQFNARIGDRLKIGDQEFRIAGKLRKIPGETLAFSLISPRVYIPIAYLDGSQLIQRGSLVRYRVYFKLDAQTDVDQLVQRISPDLQRLQLQADTVSRRTAAISAAIENLSRYLRLAVFVAVLLAGVGVASGVHVYAKEKTPSVAVLRCIGANPAETVMVYLIQVLMLTLGGSLVGALLGASLSFLLPVALKDFLPVNAVMVIAPFGIVVGLLVGLGTALLFSLIPLLPLRKISPLLALRSSYEAGQRYKDPLLWLVFLAILAAVAGFAVTTTASWFFGLWFTAGVTFAFGLLVAVARGVAILMSKVAPGFLSFPWRQGLANLHRPNNQTTAVMLAIGLGTFLLVTLYNVRSALMSQVVQRSSKGEPNLVLFDVQQQQRRDIEELVRSFNLGLYAEVPVVTMRLSAVKDRRVEEIRADANSRIPSWALRREYRSTYRSRLAGTEQIVEGNWQGKSTATRNRYRSLSRQVSRKRCV